MGDIKNAFDSVDVDGSGLVEQDEFMFSIMGEAALKYGTAADMERCARLLERFAGEFTILNGNFDDLKLSAAERAKRNKLLKDRLKGMQSELQGQINGLLSNMVGLNPEDLLSEEEITKHLTDAFNKYD